jgi:hypothetical protein
MFSKTLSPRWFLISLLLFLFLFSSPLLLSYRFLNQYGETFSPAEIGAALEQRRDSYYRSAMHDDLRETALELLRRRQPEIIALGSSLSYDLREEYFKTSFGCGCGVMDSISEGETFVDHLVHVARPRLVIFVLDFWWFTDTLRAKRQKIAPALEKPYFSFSQLSLPFKLLSRGSITFNHFIGITPFPSTRIIQNPPLGLMATIDNIGRRVDGSQFNGLVFTERAWDFYSPARERLADPDKFIMIPGRFGPDLSIREDRLLVLKRTVEKLENCGAHVILIYPPMAPQIVLSMKRSGHHQHFFGLADKIRDLGFEFYDFHDPELLGIQPGEFSDTHHAGNTAYMRLLRAVAEKNPLSPLSQLIDPARLNSLTQAYRGTTVAVLERDHVDVAETDFLGIGISKAHAPHIK